MIGPAAPTPSALAALHPLPLSAVRFSPEGLLGSWQERNAAATLPHCIDQLSAYGNLANLRRVTGDADTPFVGMWFSDTDVYKTLEAIAWEIGRSGGSSEFLADTAALLEKAQDADGYLDSYYQVDHRDEQWSDLGFSHEMYSAGHLIQAAVAAARAADAPQLVTVARRFADLLVRRFGPGGAEVIDGHPEVETALVELYRLTGHRPYLELAERFLTLRGHGLLGEGRFGPRYWQDEKPLVEAEEATGHAVRQMYLLAGAVDVAVETHATDLLDAAERLWESALASKTYLTGGQGSRHKDEGFGDPYELPPDRAYAETCAAIGSFHLAWRLLLATGKARYADEMERLLLNGIAGSTALDGRSFFYSNPLQLRTGHDGSHEDTPSQRLTWYSCACCPPNLARLMASLHTYTATGSPTGLQLHLYAAGTVVSGDHTLDVRTSYPWDERIDITMTTAGDGPWTLALRVPAWCREARLSVNGNLVRAGAQEGYLRITRSWKAGDVVTLVLAMPPRAVAAHPRVDAVRGSAALARGPVVYCLEHADVPAGTLFEDLELDVSVPLTTADHPLAPAAIMAALRARPDTSDLLYRPLEAATAGTTAVSVPAIPYFLWANRAPGPMRVWVPLAAREA
ncbi:glycoside hydrolase family 127 protein [Paractinoplanes globisporus]|uniref:Glycoside hydrolase family 127 protein n=1 Tax=Paractinoplanes globisporus TaxID=113565 RepID=A0ABW6WX82_9ACTN|nr:beta-L-arabinofuranosidase domain-containing protein [Actinoplanes globisporus]